MTGVIATIPRFQFSSSQGVPLSNGTLTIFVAGSSIPADSWQDKALTIHNTNPIRLDARGECVIWLDPTKSYKFVLRNSEGALQWTQDNIAGAAAGTLEGDLADPDGVQLVGNATDQRLLAAEDGVTMVGNAVDARVLAQDDGVELVGNAVDARVLSAAAGVSMIGVRATTLDRVLAASHARSFPRWVSAIARARAGGAFAKIACIGDSTTSGVGSNPSSATTDSRRRAYPMRLAEALRSMSGVKATAHSLWCDGFEGSNLPVFDPRLTMGAGWTVSSTFVAGGKALIDLTTTSPVLSFDPGVPTDTLDLYCVTFPGYAEFVASTGGTYNGSASTAGPQGVGKVTLKRTAVDAPWDIQKSAGTPDKILMIAGFDAYLEDDHNLSVWNMGASGSKVSHWTVDPAAYSFLAAIKVFAPDLSIINLTINDWSQNTPEADYKAGLQAMIDSTKVSGDVLLVIGVPSNVGAAPLARQELFAGYVRELAVLNDLPVLDLTDRWISQSYLPGRGFYFDGQHPSDVGYSDVGYAFASVIGKL